MAIDSSVIDLWPAGRMPGRTGTDPEMLLPDRGDAVIRATNVLRPTLTVFTPARNAGASAQPGLAPAMVICPGGAYRSLCINKEGSEAAPWLLALGIVPVVLKYRVPDNREGAFQDLQRAIRVVRHRAAEWGIDPRRIGVLGFSAGGHLCARAAAQPRQQSYLGIDQADSQSCRPACVVLVYPAYLNQGEAVAPELPLSADLPPHLFIHTADDVGFVTGSDIYHAELYAAGVDATFERFTTGGHGYGLRSTQEAGVWPERAAAWLRNRGMAGIESHHGAMGVGPRPGC